MADISAIFHWPLSELESLSTADLVKWRERAAERFGMMNHGRSPY